MPPKLKFDMADSPVHTLVAPRENSPESKYLELVDEAQRLMPECSHDISVACRSTDRMQAVIAIYEMRTLNGKQEKLLEEMRKFQRDG